MMAAGVHRLLKVTEFNASGIGRQHYDLIKQLQKHINVALFSEIHLKPHERLKMTAFWDIAPGMVTCSILWYIKMFNCQMSFSLMPWTHIT
jgi:hypothetical protein